MNAVQPNLLFIDTFYHDTNGEINLDMVQFPVSVYVQEIRIIPLGARVDIPGGEVLGETNPAQFHVDFFVNDLRMAGASTFEVLGSLDYSQDGQIHMECTSSPRIPTDGLVLRGSYTTISLAVYGKLTQVLPEAPKAVNLPPNFQRPVTRVLVSAPPPNIPQTADWYLEPSSPIPAYTGKVTVCNPEVYGSNYPENYSNQIYSSSAYYENEFSKDLETFHQMHNNKWDKERAISCGKEGDQLKYSPKLLKMDTDKKRCDEKSHRRSIKRVRSWVSSRHSNREFVVKTLSRSQSVSVERKRDRQSYQQNDKHCNQHASYPRSRSRYKRYSYHKRSSSYECKGPCDGDSYEKQLSSVLKRSMSYERCAPPYIQIPYDSKRYSPYNPMSYSGYGSRSLSRDGSRKRPGTPSKDIKSKLPKENESSPIYLVQSKECPEFDKAKLYEITVAVKKMEQKFISNSLVIGNSSGKGLALQCKLNSLFVTSLYSNTANLKQPSYCISV